MRDSSVNKVAMLLALIVIVGAAVYNYFSPQPGMKAIRLGWALINLDSGLVSAYYWYLASRVKISPAWALDIRGDREKNVMGWVSVRDSPALETRGRRLRHFLSRPAGLLVGWRNP